MAHIGHPRNPGYQAGQWWVECQRCGLDYLQKDILIEWTGAILCKECYDPRHPQEFVRGKEDRQTPSDPQRANGPANETYRTVTFADSDSLPDGTFGEP